MGLTMRWIRTCVILTCTACFILFGMAGTAGAVDEKMLERMEQIIKQQQAQIEAQAKALEKLQQQVEALSEKAVQEATGSSQGRGCQAAVPPDVLRTKGGDKVSVQLYGQVNRAFLAADDGDSSDYYFVDNDNSSSR
jgi:hypothetical protein